MRVDLKNKIIFPNSIDPETEARTIKFFCGNCDKEESEDLINQVICHEAIFNVSGDFWLNALFYISYYYIDLIPVMIKKGSDLESRGVNNRTILIYTTFSKHLEELFPCLLSLGANVYAQDFDGSSSERVVSDLKERELAYKNFYERKSVEEEGDYIPKCASDVFRLMSVYPIPFCDRRQKINYSDNLLKIMRHVEWEKLPDGNQRLANILDEIRETGVISELTKNQIYNICTPELAYNRNLSRAVISRF